MLLGGLVLSVVWVVTGITVQAENPALRGEYVLEGETFLQAPPFDAFEAMPGEALRLLGMRLIHDGEPLTAMQQPWQLEPALPLTLQLFWHVQHPIQESLPAMFQFVTPDGVVSRGIESEIGPEPGDSWARGAVYRHEETIELGLIAGRFSGDAQLRVFIGNETAPTEQVRFQQQVALKLRPLLGPRRVGALRYSEFFGEQYHSLDVGFRLGRGVRQRIALGDAADKSLRGIGLVSAYGYNAIPQGEKVGECLVYDGEELVAELPLRSGVDTARSDYDFDPAAREHEKIAIIDSDEADYLDVHGAPFQRHKYVATLELPAPLRADRLEFAMTARGTLEIFDIVLLPESTS